ncbi:MAG: alkaline phosphatase family protein [Chitinophagaceae bacterium]|nr:MAG: alkaline phosphatase family protein [Chitinophagaceae bacterium]
MTRVLLALFLLCSGALSAQIISGPMLGPVELRDATVWVSLRGGAQKLELLYFPVPPPGVKAVMAGKIAINKPGAGAHALRLNNLKPGTRYRYLVTVEDPRIMLADGTRNRDSGSFTTKELWQWRKPAPDFYFLTGSCAYFNEPEFDRPGKPYGGDSSIFLTMAKEDAAFTLWLGDNWYYREVDFFSTSGLWYRAGRDRAQEVLRPLLRKMPHYAIWDDHDFGPNDADKSYVLKEESRKVFTSYWPNTSAGENGQGIYTKTSYSDVDIFMMDDRWFRSANALNRADSSKRMWAAQQLEWLKNALLASGATFKIIATGNQTLNRMAQAECLQDYPVEFNELLAFLERQRVDGVLFLTGDRHHSEVVRWDRPGSYPLFDVTNSPFTSGVSRVTGTREEANPQRLPGTLVEAQNYSRVRVSGGRGQRRLQVEFVGIDGRTLGSWSVSESELKTPATR